MLYLLLGVFCSTLLVIILKLFPKYKVNTLHGIVINYITCVLFGCVFTATSPATILKGFQAPWTPIALLLGFLFITIFNFSAITSQKIGVSVTSMAMKLAFIFPIALGIFLYNENGGWIKLVGIAIAIVAVVLTSITQQDTKNTSVGGILFFLPLIVFVGSGACDSLVQYAQRTFFVAGGFELFSIMLFFFAALLGLLFALYRAYKLKESLTIKSIIGGVLLGIPNYLSIYFLFQALLKTGWESTVVFPLVNISVVISTTIAGFILFKEKLNRYNQVGILLAIVAVFIITWTTRA